MFRNPRENASLPDDKKLSYSTGRLPSPLPQSNESTAQRKPSNVGSINGKGTKMAVKSTPAKPRSTAQPKSNIKSNGKTKVLPNQTITSFFKKAAPVEESLFFGSSVEKNSSRGLWDEHEDLAEELYEDPDRYHENGGSTKRRKTSDIAESAHVLEVDPPQRECTPPPSETTEVANVEASAAEEKNHNASKRLGPFLEDSDGDDEGLPMQKSLNHGFGGISTNLGDKTLGEQSVNGTVEPGIADETEGLPREEAPSGEGDDFEGFESIEDFEEGPEEGEEYQERRWMEQQVQLEMEDGLLNSDIIDPTIEGIEDVDAQEEECDQSMETSPTGDAYESSCPICNVSLAGVSDSDASIHVNNCLDGNPTLLPDRNPAVITPIINGASKLRRPTRPAKPGQQNPFSLTPADGESKSAFARLMTNHAEDMAWKTAAASEASSRGKPAYQRTCPFYKILPGFSICVDAFRYGAVEGCQAYFLSHFHSDHYIGLTANWSHGPIYCSKVTANLVRTQLRVDPKYVIDLDFDQEREVPGTAGVRVSMIPANHCPGSSLFLFEKAVGKGKKRVLHCGDFRACRAHIEHPLLRPDILDTISGKTREQRIDVCYLDTTYLNPKYAFPSQEEVIQACADMCVSLNPSFADKDDGWETMKRERAGSGMVKFLENGSKPIKQEDNAETNDGCLANAPLGRLLVVVGTYSIGKERICLGIAKALNSKIYAPASKQRIVSCLEDPELTSLMTSNPREAQVHMTSLFEIRAETLDEYLRDYSDTFSRAVGFRPTGWNYRPPNSRFVESPAVNTVLYGANWKSGYSVRELVPQRGSTKRASCFGVPYSEHSSFRELSMFCCALRIERVIPTVNVGSARSREKMRVWVDRWAVERRKAGLFKAEHF